MECHNAGWLVWNVAFFSWAVQNERLDFSRQDKVGWLSWRSYFFFTMDVFTRTLKGSEVCVSPAISTRCCFLEAFS